MNNRDKLARIFAGLPSGVSVHGVEWRFFANRKNGRSAWITSAGDVRRDHPGDASGGVQWLPVADIGIDPKRLQFKPFDGPDGLSFSRRAEPPPYDAYSGPPVAVWKDETQGGRPFVVDGFGRLNEARKLGHPFIRAKWLEAPDANAAKEAGRRLNVVKLVDPVDSKLALAGTDGRELARLMSKAREYAEETLTRTLRASLRGYSGDGPLFGKDALKEVATMFAAIRGSAELLGRARIREKVDRVGMPDDEPLAKFKEGDPSVLATPEDAVAYFQSLVPELGIDPRRWIGEQRRRAFTIAVSTNRTLTAKVQEKLAEGLKNNESTADITAKLTRMLESVGVGSRNPQYVEMVVRTNINETFQTGAWEEAQSPDVKHVFPVWEYLGINDHRAGEDHRPRFGKFYPREASFADVRGPRPYNCRCSLRWIDVYQWKELTDSGKRVETSWEPISL